MKNALPSAHSVVCHHPVTGSVDLLIASDPPSDQQEVAQYGLVFNSRLVEAGDVPALADAMLQLAVSPDLRRRLGDAGLSGSCRENDRNWVDGVGDGLR